MGVFLEQSNFLLKGDIPEELLEEAKTYSLERPKQESCGIFTLEEGDYKFIPLENLSASPEKTFMINPAYILMKNIYCIFHSHVNISEKPSFSDKQNSCMLGLPFLIYSLKTDCFYFHEISV